MPFPLKPSKLSCLLQRSFVENPSEYILPGSRYCKWMCRIYFKVNFPTKCSKASDWADSSSLVAEDSCAAAELF